MRARMNKVGYLQDPIPILQPSRQTIGQNLRQVYGYIHEQISFIQ